MSSGLLLHEEDPVLVLGQGDVAYPLYDEFDRSRRSMPRSPTLPRRSALDTTR